MKLRTARKIVRREFEPSEKPARYKPNTVRKAIAVFPDALPQWIIKSIAAGGK